MIIAKAPLRISLAGGGTDLPSYYERYGGFILTAAIDKYVFISANRLQLEDFIRVKYMRTELVQRAEEIEHPLLRECLLHLEIATGGLEISSMADVPGGTGMGSSGCFTVALLTALHALKHDDYTTHQLAEEACHVEMVRARQPVGKQDQYAAAYGGVITMDIARNGSVQVERAKIGQEAMEALRERLLLFFTGVRRDSFDILGEQQQKAADGDANVVENLRRTHELGYRAYEAMQRGDLDGYGRLLHEHWVAKQALSKSVADGRVQGWYRRAREAGALGGKLLGAGGGGFLLAYCPEATRSAVRAALAAEGLREVTFRFEPHGAHVIART